MAETKINQGNDSRAAGRDYLENPTIYSSHTFKSLSFKNQQIKVFDSFLNKFDSTYISFSLLIIMPILITFSLFDFFKFDFNIFQIFSISLVLSFLYLFLFLIILIIFLKYSSIKNLNIGNDKITITNRKKEIKESINFNEIRKILKLKNIYGYSIYIYSENKIYPVISFSVESFHLANTIEELILNILNQKDEDDKKIVKPKIIIRAAILEDIDLIFNLIIDGAKYNSFNSFYNNTLTHKGLIYQIKSTIIDNKMPINKGFLNSNLYVIKDNNEMVGFSWIRYHSKDECEQYMSSVILEKRSQGFYTALLLETEKFISSNYVYADIYHNSKSANIVKEILIKNGFKKVKTNNKETARYYKTLD